MNSKEDFDVFVGGKSGVFKGVRIDKKECVVKNIQQLSAITDNDQVTTMSWGDTEEKEVLIACGVKGVRSVKVYDTESNVFSCSFLCDIGEGGINGISRYDEAILTAVQSGEIKLWRFKEKDEILLNAGSNLYRMRHSKENRNIIATGGQEHQLKLFDLERQTQTFIEKNLPHDWLQLRVPIWISDIDFLPGTEQIATVGRYGHVRLYDPKAQRRPVVNLEVKDEALTALAVTPREKQIIVGSGKGRMNLVDLRKPCKILNTYKGYVGSITGLACSTTEPYVVSVGLDRYLQVHDINTKKLLKKVYLTSKLTCMLLRSGFSFLTEDESHEENTNKQESNFAEDNHKKKFGVKSEDSKKDIDSDQEYDMLFDKMQVIGNKDAKKSIDKKKRKVKETVSSDNEVTSDDITHTKNGRSESRSKKLKSKPK